MRTVIALATAGLTVLSSTAWGQLQPSPPRPVFQGRMNLSQPSNLRLEFPGGPLSDFVAAVRAASPDPTNIVLQPGSETVPVPPMTLVDVSVESALRAALEPLFIESEVGPDRELVKITITMVMPEPDVRPVFIISRRTAPAPHKQSPRSTEVFSIQRLVMGAERDGITPVPERVILEAIDAGLALSQHGESPRPEINYHKDSGLLLVHALPADVRLVQDVVKRLTEDYIIRASEAVQARRHKIERAAEMAKFEVRMNLAKQRLSVAESRVEQFRKLAEQGQGSMQEMAQAELALAEARAEYDLASIDLNRMREEAELRNVPMPVDPQPEPRGAGRPKGR